MSRDWIDRRIVTYASTVARADRRPAAYRAAVLRDIDADIIACRSDRTRTGGPGHAEETARRSAGG
jgi:hypothetical protein